VTAMALL